MGREDVEPDKANESTNNDGAEGGKNEEALCEGDDSKSAEGGNEKAAGEAVQSVGDVDGVGGGCDDENEEGNVPPINKEIADAGKVDLVVAETEVEP